MLYTIFENDKIYYFKNTEELPDFDTILSRSDFSIFNPIDASLSDSIGIIKNKLESSLKEKVELSNYIKDSVDFNEVDIINISLWDLSEKYDWDIFDGLEIVSGIELNNIIESDDLILA